MGNNILKTLILILIVLRRKLSNPDREILHRAWEIISVKHNKFEHRPCMYSFRKYRRV